MSREFAGSLRERITIEQPVEERTALGVQGAGWKAVAKCLAAIIPEGVGGESEGQALSAMARFQVTIRTRDGVAIGQRLRWGSRVLTVRQRVDDPRQADRIVLRCEEIRG